MKKTSFAKPVNLTRYRDLTLLMVICTLLTLPNISQARVYLELDSPNLRRIPLAVAPLQPLCGASTNTEIAQQGRKILIDDLEFSTFFELLLDTENYLEKPKKCSLSPGTFDYSNWSLIGAEPVSYTHLTLPTKA